MIAPVPLPTDITVAALIVAAGRGMRAGGDLPKQYVRLARKSVLAMSIEALAADPRIGALLCVIHPNDAALYDEILETLDPSVRERLLTPVHGGETRQVSGRHGLEALGRLATPPGIVLVHDAARPFVSVDLVGRSIEAAWLNGAAIPAIAVTDTIKRVDLHGKIVETPVRRDLKAVQTPQAFRFETILEAHRAAWAQVGSDFTDDASIAEWAGHSVYVFPGDADNVKLTTAADFAAARERLMIETETRTGIGYDLGADVVLHAVTDAILGALANGDIGSHFPPSDPQWKGAASRIFLDHAVALVKARGGRILHLDTVVICEAPKIGPHREAMRTAIAAICGISIDRVGVKATTSEQLGFTGRREGIAAQAIATLALPGSA